MTPQRDPLVRRSSVAQGPMAGWPANQNHEAARRHVNQILRNHGRPDYARRETEIAQLLDDLVRERDELRGQVYGTRTEKAA